MNVFAISLNEAYDPSHIRLLILLFTLVVEATDTLLSSGRCLIVTEVHAKGRTEHEKTFWYDSLCSLLLLAVHRGIVHPERSSGGDEEGDQRKRGCRPSTFRLGRKGSR